MAHSAQPQRLLVGNPADERLSVIQVNALRLAMVDACASMVSEGVAKGVVRQGLLSEDNFIKLESYIVGDELFARLISLIGSSNMVSVVFCPMEHTDPQFIALQQPKHLKTGILLWARPRNAGVKDHKLKRTQGEIAFVREARKHKGFYRLGLGPNFEQMQFCHSGIQPNLNYHTVGKLDRTCAHRVTSRGMCSCHAQHIRQLGRPVAILGLHANYDIKAQWLGRCLANLPQGSLAVAILDVHSTAAASDDGVVTTITDRLTSSTGDGDVVTNHLDRWSSYLDKSCHNYGLFWRKKHVSLLVHRPFENSSLRIVHVHRHKGRAKTVGKMIHTANQVAGFPITYEVAGVAFVVTLTLQQHSLCMIAGVGSKSAEDAARKITNMWRPEPSWPALTSELLKALTKEYCKISADSPISVTTVVQPLKSLVKRYSPCRDGLYVIRHRLGLKLNGVLPGVFSNNEQNELVALANRALVEHPNGDYYKWMEVMAIFIVHLRSIGMNCVEAMSSEEFLSQIDSAKRRETALRAVRLIERDDITPDSHKTKTKAFVKHELAATQTAALQAVPRAIQGPDEVTKVLLGKWCKPLSKEFARVTQEHAFAHPNHSAVYTSGMSPLRLGALFTTMVDAGMVMGVEADGSRFDAHVSLAALRAERHFKEAFGFPDDVLSLLEQQEAVSGISAHGYVYDRVASRKSGDPNTSEGNTTLNLAMHYEFMMRNFPNRLWAILALGDDIVIVMEASVWHDFDPVFYKVELEVLGFNFKLIKRSCLSRVSFCSSLFYPCFIGENPTHVLAPRPGRALVKWGLTYQDTAKISKERAIMRGNALSLMPHALAVPVLKECVLKAVGKDSDPCVWDDEWAWRALNASRKDLEFNMKFVTLTLKANGMDLTPVWEDMIWANYGMKPKEMKDAWNGTQQQRDELLLHLLAMEAEEAW
jgi:hypothetical protein